MIILITGNRGFIGRNFTRMLEAQGHTVYGFDLRVASHGFLCDAIDYFRFGEPTVFDLVIHCAAYVGGRENIENNPMQVAMDYAIDSTFFNWALKTKQKRVVYFSSSAVYPTSLQVPENKMTEDLVDVTNPNKSVEHPDSLYGWVKLTGEMLANKAKEKGLNVHVVRPFSGYGDDQDLVYPFPSFIERAIKRVDPFPIFGDGLQVRDFVHVEDIYGAIMAMVENKVYGPINIGWGRPTNFLELKQLVCAAVDYNPKIELWGDKPVGAIYRCSDNTKMLEFYQPKITLEEGIKRALKYNQ